MYNVIRLSPSRSRRVLSIVGRAIDPLAERVDRGIARLASLVERLPSWSWPLLVAVAAWPNALWALRRLLDDSDDPLGIVALAALMLALWQSRTRFASTPRVGLLAWAAIGVVAANAPVGALPDLVRALFASLAIVVALAAIADRDEPIAPYAGLAVLSLPLLSSLQFYAGFPLRVVTAEASRWLLVATGSEVTRLGSALTIDGHLVLVDAPCSGVQMAWVGYFTACVTAWMFRVSNRSFLSRLPLVSITVLAGNIVRNTILVAADADGVAMTDAMHAAVGLLSFAIVAAIIAGVFASVRRPKARAEATATRPAISRPAPSLRMTLVSTLLIAAMLPCAAPRASAHGVARTIEWPATWEGEPATPLALSAVERRFAAQFPGTIARFATPTRTVVLRDVEQPTRRLHPAVDCYRGLGFVIADEHLERDAEARFWRCFDATRKDAGLRVCERIVDRDGRAYTDVSSWFWAASLSQSKGPWQAVTVATPLAERAAS